MTAYRDGIARLDNGRWRVRVKVRGRAVVATFDKKRDAERRRDELRLAANVPQAPTARISTLTVAELLGHYARTEARTHRSRDVDGRIARIAAALGHHRARTLTPEQVAAWARTLAAPRPGAARVRSPSTVKHYVDTLAAAWRAAVRDGLLAPGAANPAAEARALLGGGRAPVIGTGARRERRVSDAEVARLLAHARYPTDALIRFALASGFRAGELARLTWADVGTDTVRVANAKQRPGAPAYRRAPLTGAMRAVLDALPRGLPRTPLFPRTRGVRAGVPASLFLDANTISSRFARLRAAAGIADLRFHDLRHEALSRLGDLGLSERVLQAFSGHSDARTLARYVHTDAAAIAALVDRASGR